MRLVACYVRNMPSIRRDSLPKEFSNPKAIDEFFAGLLFSYLDLESHDLKIVKTESVSVGLVHAQGPLTTVIGPTAIFVFEAE